MLEFVNTATHLPLDVDGIYILEVDWLGLYDARVDLGRAIAGAVVGAQMELARRAVAVVVVSVHSKHTELVCGCCGKKNNRIK
jgi:hypothetical protein